MITLQTLLTQLVTTMGFILELILMLGLLSITVWKRAETGSQASMFSVKHTVNNKRLSVILLCIVLSLIALAACTPSDRVTDPLYLSIIYPQQIGSPTDNVIAGYFHDLYADSITGNITGNVTEVDPVFTASPSFSITVALKNSYDWLVTNFTVAWKKSVDNFMTSTINGHAVSSNYSVTKSDVGLSNVPNLDTTNAVNNQHTHSNKSTLDNIQEAFTTALKTTYDTCATAFTAAYKTTLDTFMNSKAAANGLASLSASSLVVQNPANATATAAANKIPISEADTFINQAWLGSGASSTNFLRGDQTWATPTVINYTLQAACANQVTTVDANTMYWGGMFSAVPSTTAARWRIYIPYTGTIKAAYVYSYSGTAGTNENWSMYIRYDNTSDTLIQTLAANTNDRVWSNAGLSIAVTQGHYIEIKEIQPTWSTNPANVTRTAVIYINV